MSGQAAPTPQSGARARRTPGPFHSPGEAEARKRRREGNFLFPYTVAIQPMSVYIACATSALVFRYSYVQAEAASMRTYVYTHM